MRCKCLGLLGVYLVLGGFVAFGAGTPLDKMDAELPTVQMPFWARPPAIVPAEL